MWPRKGTDEEQSEISAGPPSEKPGLARDCGAAGTAWTSRLPSEGGADARKAGSRGGCHRTHLKAGIRLCPH